MNNFDVIIPARLKSTRYPNKVLYNFYELPMLEHVRRRALLIKGVSKVVVATCDNEIYDLVKSNNGHAIMTSYNCNTGTERVAEAAKKLDSQYIILLQGDEPCFYPSDVEDLITYINKTQCKFYNIVSPLDKKITLKDVSSVKCSLNQNNDITGCFRTTPYISNFDFQKLFVKKLLGIMCFDRTFLININSLKQSKISSQESIEQLRLLDNKILMKAFEVKRDVPSFNVVEDIKKLEVEFKSIQQQKILNLIL